MTIPSLIQKFDSLKIIVVGDVILDRYIYGRVERISPEAPIPIVEWQESMLVPGGAGNTAANLSALGAEAILFGLKGYDSEAKELEDTLTAFHIDATGLLEDNRPTSEKTRILGNHQQIVRIDHEQSRPLSPEATKRLCQAIEPRLSSCQAIIVCDYAKGVATPELLDFLRQAAKRYKVPILADVKPQHKALYHNLSYITPNRREAAGMIGQPLHTLEDYQTEGLQLAQELKTNMLITMSEEGMILIDYKGGTATHLPTKAQEVIDVSGAGDTVIAGMAISLAAGAKPLQAAQIATQAASIVVGKLGTATVTKEELLQTF